MENSSTNTNKNIALVDNNNIISSDIETAKKPNAFFCNIVELNIKVKYKKYKIQIQIQKYPKYKNHPGIKMTIIKHFHLTLFHLTPFLSKSYP